MSKLAADLDKYANESRRMTEECRNAIRRAAEALRAIEDYYCCTATLPCVECEAHLEGTNHGKGCPARIADVGPEVTDAK